MKRFWCSRMIYALSHTSDENLVTWWKKWNISSSTGILCKHIPNNDLFIHWVFIVLETPNLIRSYSCSVILTARNFIPWWGVVLAGNRWNTEYDHVTTLRKVNADWTEDPNQYETIVNAPNSDIVKDRFVKVFTWKESEKKHVKIPHMYRTQIPGHRILIMVCSENKVQKILATAVADKVLK